jgi:hypothetical protein
MTTAIGSDTASAGKSIDALLDVYVCWRAACRAVRRTYQLWAGSERGQADLAYADYVAALDREEQAARAYAHQIERVRRVCP